MIKRVYQIAGLALFLLFTGETVALGACHRAHGAIDPTHHEASTCPVCQLAGTPAILAPMAVAPVAEAILLAPLKLPRLPLPFVSWHGPDQTRAPPVR